MYVNVLIELKAKNIDKTYTYFVPDKFKKSICVGKRVLVPFGHQTLEGFILEIYDYNKLDQEAKSIIDVIDEYPVLNKELLELGKYISSKTLSNLISSYQIMLPTALKAHKGSNINKKYLVNIRLINTKYIPKNDNQRKIIKMLLKEDILKSELIKISSSSINTLIRNKVIEEVKEEKYRLKENIISNKKEVVLTLEQKSVINTVTKKLDEFIPYLLFGVTGSGKTEVYIRIIEKVLEENKEVIVLVPEISLTPQLVNIFKGRFKSSVAILHSGLSDGEKYDEWRKIERKEVSIVIGARSAIFAPFTNLGLIILDEEHSDTYKQDNNPKYDSIDIALKRAKTHNCPIILGSATPSIESFTRAKLGVYKLLELKHRINNNMPNVKIIDMREEIKKGNRILSQELINGIREALSKNEQVILLLNRRGYSTTIVCKECGLVMKCPNCDIPLTYHKNGNKLNCHYCNYTTYKPIKCPDCKSNNINDLGLGTEKLEEEVKSLFSNALTVRMDIDTTRKKGNYERIINSFKNKQYNILIGTQMISKGLDFEDVTLVGVINGDSTLNIPDFRSAERTYCLLNQVAGRAGRAEKIGNVIIQCYNIDHYSIVYASKHDYLKFYNEEICIRKKIGYPPYYNLSLIKLSGNKYEVINEEANKIRAYLLDNTKDVIVLGPSLCIIPKINNKYFIQIILKYKNIKQVYNELKFIINKGKNNKNINIDIDFNPKKI